MEDARLLRPVWFGGTELPPSGPILRQGARGKARQQSATVLVVDDERLIADSLKAILEVHGFIAIATYSGEEGLQAALRIRPDIVISDVLMPGISGIEMAIRLTQSLEDTRVILFSGQASTAELIHQAAGAGHHFELLAKPLHPEELMAKIKQLLPSIP
jgi:DNA-binding response OmpR family regulator